MFVSAKCLPHLLQPTAYHSNAQYERECQALLSEAWFFVGTTGELSKPGSFLTTNFCGRPLQVRNDAGRLVAFSNVCSHRHCLLTDQARGQSEKITCQYHGWQYDGDGSTRRIPEPKNFAPINREALRLTTYRVEQCGQLVFVCLSPTAGSLEDFLGELYATCQQRFSEDWQCHLRWEPNYPVNWKIPLENSLEAYHVPSVHPGTFRDDPGELRSEHRLDHRHTSMTTDLPFSPHSQLDAWFQNCEDRVVRWLGKNPKGKYQQHHVFPNLMFSFTDAISLCHCLVPTGPTTARGILRQFSLVGRHSGSLRRLGATCWGKLKAAITQRVLQEDMALFPAIQAGLNASQQPGVLGRCEERIHHFQAYLLAATTASSAAQNPATPDSLSPLLQEPHR